MSDGLAALTQQREKASKRASARTVPPPRHAPKPAAPTPEAAMTPAAEEEHQANEPSTPPLRATLPNSPPKPESGGVAPLTRSTIYLDADGDAFLEHVNIIGRRSRPKIDGSRSAVVRLALQHLQDQLTPQQVIDELRARATTNPQNPGRPRL